jgi:hypothetical protein
MLAVFYKYGNGMVASQKGFVHATTRKVFRQLPGSYVRDKSRKDHVRVSSRRYTMFEHIEGTLLPPTLSHFTYSYIIAVVV